MLSQSLPPSHSTCTAHAPVPKCHAPSSAAPYTPISSRQTTGQDESPVNASAPQCCHCGWRGSHSPTCPFR
ncbi:uncharacterized protein STEHIDRAFT_143789 [Stereum hirsutum FP-91666 SS1]|uniref:uncharacterized protein n=1 Tax=Stereum hirsutum (strain FP-91666) TaxID=721885 RepID=UPI000440FD80|nr:uncharacterized protein STEHIDRAFT_143789 [Stereum hirsutum FP-91666 SS1]EIM92420.1 hypothetical protein STEHIDRAFT_143789 [Stereum hirsutum FP-91666 SS1]